LGPLLFIIFISDLVSTCDDSVNLYLFADDAKLYYHIKDDVDKAHLQKATDSFVEWTDKWQMKLNKINAKSRVAQSCYSVIGDKPFLWSKPKFDPP